MRGGPCHSRLPIHISGVGAAPATFTSSQLGWGECSDPTEPHRRNSGCGRSNTSSLGQGWGAEKQFRTFLFTPLCSEIQRLCAVKRETRQEGVSTCPPSCPSSSESLCLTHIHRGSRRPAAALRSEDTALAGVAQLVGGSSLGPKGGGISSQLGCTPRSPVRSQVGALMGDNRWMFLCPPLSLLTPLSGIKGRVLK